MTEDEQPKDQAVVSEGPKPKKESDWFPVSIPKAILPKIDAVYELKGFRSRAAYVRNAVLKQLEIDESDRRESGGSESVKVESGVPDNTVA